MTPDEWVSVYDALPTVGIDVLCAIARPPHETGLDKNSNRQFVGYRPSQSDTAFCLNSERLASGKNTELIYRVTHWRFLPPLPK